MHTTNFNMVILDANEKDAASWQKKLTNLGFDDVTTFHSSEEFLNHSSSEDVKIELLLASRNQFIF